jgi:polysaccharide deacetylase family protein (PEP-CTERM system associated)
MATKDINVTARVKNRLMPGPATTMIDPSATAYRTTHALSFDIEDWFHIVGIAGAEDRATWGEFPSIVERRTREIVELLGEFKVRATFFILGWVAERYPTIVRMIRDEGHEIGTHSFWHRKVYDLTPEEFHEDLVDSIDVLEQHAGVKVHGFRAPSFSIIPGMEWAFDVIKKAGLEYDASLFPVPRAHGGYPCELGPCVISGTDGARVAELPASVMSCGRKQFCYSGGGYFRLLPRWLIERGIRSAEKAGRPSVIYLHPRDFATDCPTMPMPLVRRFKSYVGRKTTSRKLRHLLENYRFGTCLDVLQANLLVGVDAKTVESQALKSRTVESVNQ